MTRGPLLKVWRPAAQLCKRNECIFCTVMRRYQFRLLAPAANNQLLGHLLQPTVNVTVASVPHEQNFGKAV